ncbi:MAG: hypothetical protein PHG40_01660 [Candidatus Omnitrophica bacterium]|nr:hypothetical protein [Candidatus Omnitrophota bacterium]
MADEQVKAQAAPAAPAPVVEKQANCLACGKPIKKLKRYYRDGKFYCTKKCWINYKNKSKETKE